MIGHITGRIGCVKSNNWSGNCKDWLVTGRIGQITGTTGWVSGSIGQVPGGEVVR